MSHPRKMCHSIFKVKNHAQQIFIPYGPGVENYLLKIMLWVTRDAIILVAVSAKHFLAIVNVAGWLMFCLKCPVVVAPTYSPARRS